MSMRSNVRLRLSCPASASVELRALGGWTAAVPRRDTVTSSRKISLWLSQRRPRPGRAGTGCRRSDPSHHEHGAPAASTAVPVGGVSPSRRSIVAVASSRCALSSVAVPACDIVPHSRKGVVWVLLPAGGAEHASVGLLGRANPHQTAEGDGPSQTYQPTTGGGPESQAGSVPQPSRVHLVRSEKSRSASDEASLTVTSNSQPPPYRSLLRSRPSASRRPRCGPRPCGRPATYRSLTDLVDSTRHTWCRPGSPHPTSGRDT